MKELQRWHRCLCRSLIMKNERGCLERRLCGHCGKILISKDENKKEKSKRQEEQEKGEWRE